MARFFVGQRVKVVQSIWPQNMGVEGTILHTGVWKNGDVLPSGRMLSISSGATYVDLYVSWDRPVFAGGSDRQQAPINSSRVEPILPEGAAPGEFTFQKLMENVGMVPA